jgi:hypothetical protein
VVKEKMYRELTDKLKRRDSAAVYKEQPNRTKNSEKRIQKKKRLQGYDQTAKKKKRGISLAEKEQRTV